MDKGRHIFLEKVVNRLVKDTIITYDKYEGDDVVITPFPSVDGYFTKFWFTRKSIGSRMPSFKSYIEYTYGVTDTEEINLIYSSYESIISDKLYGDIINENMNNSIDGKVKKLLDRIIEWVVSETNISYRPESYIDEACEILIDSPFLTECLSRFIYYDVGIIDEYLMERYSLEEYERDYVWDNYREIIIDKSKNLLEKNGKLIKENIYHDMFGEKVSNYMEKVLKYLVEDTYIYYHTILMNETIMIEVPFTDLQYSRIRHFNVGFFIDYCMDTYGLTRKESEYLWGDYLNEIDYILKYEFGIKDPVYR